LQSLSKPLPMRASEGCLISYRTYCPYDRNPIQLDRSHHNQCKGELRNNQTQTDADLKAVARSSLLHELCASVYFFDTIPGYTLSGNLGTCRSYERADFHICN
jgi:hypothetical protein